MQDLITRRYVVYILEIVGEYCSHKPSAMENLPSEVPLVEQIMAELHDTFSARVQ